jgi:hypothetical protein
MHSDGWWWLVCVNQWNPRFSFWIDLPKASEDVNDITCKVNTNKIPWPFQKCEDISLFKREGDGKVHLGVWVCSPYCCWIYASHASLASYSDSAAYSNPALFVSYCPGSFIHYMVSSMQLFDNPCFHDCFLPIYKYNMSSNEGREIQWERKGAWKEGWRKVCFGNERSGNERWERKNALTVVNNQHIMLCDLLIIIIKMTKRWNQVKLGNFY